MSCHLARDSVLAHANKRTALPLPRAETGGLHLSFQSHNLVSLYECVSRRGINSVLNWIAAAANLVGLLHHGYRPAISFDFKDPVDLIATTSDFPAHD